jgi:hypothetical protein
MAKGMAADLTQTRGVSALGDVVPVEVQVAVAGEGSLVNQPAAPRNSQLIANETGI